MPSSFDKAFERFARQAREGYVATVRDARAVHCHHCGDVIRWQYGTPRGQSFCNDNCAVAFARSAWKPLLEPEPAKEVLDLPDPAWGEVAP